MRVLLCLAFAATLIACDAPPKKITAVYELPAGFTGWVTIVFAVPEAPALPVRDGARVLRIPPSGTLATSSPQQLGVVDYTFFYVDDAGRRTPIAWPAAATGDQPAIRELNTGHATADGRTRVFEQFYVGRGPAGDAPPPP